MVPEAPSIWTRWKSLSNRQFESHEGGTAPALLVSQRLAFTHPCKMSAQRNDGIMENVSQIPVSGVFSTKYRQTKGVYWKVGIFILAEVIYTTTPGAAVQHSTRTSVHKHSAHSAITRG